MKPTRVVVKKRTRTVITQTYYAIRGLYASAGLYVFFTSGTDPGVGTVRWVINSDMTVIIKY
jgi:hypothetical protein